MVVLGDAVDENDWDNKLVDRDDVVKTLELK
jgi:hypothetical protein